MDKSMKRDSLKKKVIFKWPIGQLERQTSGQKM